MDSIRGIYINLDRADDRRAHMERELRKFGLAERYSRFQAVDARAFPARHSRQMLKDSEIATFKSHYEVLRLAAASDHYVHVMEDDVVLSPWLAPVLSFFVRTGLCSVFDLVFLNFMISGDPYVLGKMDYVSRSAFATPAPDRGPEDFSLVDVVPLYRWGGDSYLINPHSAQRLLSIYEAELKDGPRVGIDFLFQREMRAGRIRAGAILPFLTTLAPDHSELSQNPERYQAQASIRAHRLLREVFYADRDLDAILAETDALAEAVPRSTKPDREILHKLLRVLLDLKVDKG